MAHGGGSSRSAHQFQGALYSAPSSTCPPGMQLEVCPYLAVKESGGCRPGLWLRGLVALAACEHGVQHVDPPPRQAECGLLVSLPSLAFAILVGA
jgi:hypothetical protein